MPTESRVFHLTFLCIATAAQLVAQKKDAEIVAYYLPKTVLTVNLDVKKKVWQPGPMSEVTKHFFPMANAKKPESYAAGLLSNDIITAPHTTYILSEPSIVASGIPDSARAVSVKTKGVLKDISLGLNYNEDGVITSASYSIKDRKWDFLFRILTTAANLAGAGFVTASTQPGIPGTSNSLFTALEAFDGSGCPYTSEMTAEESTFYNSRSIRTMLKLPYCLLPLEHRGKMRELNNSTGAGVAAFLSYFSEELKRACGGPSCKVIKDEAAFRDSLLQTKVRKFFEAWVLVAELEQHQEAYKVLMGDYSKLPSSSESLRIAMAEREKRISFIGEQFFGSEATSLFWSGIFRVERDEALMENQPTLTLFCFNAQPAPNEPAVTRKAGTACSDGSTEEVRTLSIWPGKEETSAPDYKPVQLTLKSLSTAKSCVIKPDAFYSRIPHRYEVSIAIAEPNTAPVPSPSQKPAISSTATPTFLYRKDFRMSQNGECAPVNTGNNGTLDFTFDPITGELRKSAQSRTTALTPELAGQIDGLGNAILGASRAAIAAGQSTPGPSPLQLMELEVRKRLLQACLDNPVLPECIAYLTKQ